VAQDGQGPAGELRSGQPTLDEAAAVHDPESVPAQPAPLLAVPVRRKRSGVPVGAATDGAPWVLCQVFARYLEHGPRKEVPAVPPESAEGDPLCVTQEPGGLVVAAGGALQVR